MKHGVWMLLLLLGSSYTAEDIALNTETKLRSLKSMKANFDQIYYSSSVSTPLKEKGKFYFKKPDLMKWEYKEPEKKIFILKEGAFQFYVPEDNQLFRSSLSQEGHEAEILYLLSGKKRLMDNYSIEISHFPSENPKALQLKLTSRVEDDYSFILLEIDERTWLIRKAIFFDWADNKTEFIFSKIRTNIQIAKDMFELKVPPDVEIIENQTNKN